MGSDEQQRRWSEHDRDMAQTAMFDVVIDQIVPSLHAADQPQVSSAEDGEGCDHDGK